MNPSYQGRNGSLPGNYNPHGDCKVAKDEDVLEQ